MMVDGYGGGGAWTMWVFGGLMMIGVLLLIGLLAWAIVTVTSRAHPAGASSDALTTAAAGRGRTRQLLDDRYARGELTTDEYTERLHTLAL